MVDIRNVAVLIYIVIGYAAGIVTLICSDSIFMLSVATLLLAHCLCWSGYMHHELCHYSVFKELKWNVRVGRLLDWLSGACYWTFEELREQHIKHHVYKVDYDIASDIMKRIQANRILEGTLLWSEYFYIPLHAYIVHWRSVLAPWWKSERKAMRCRTALIIVIRAIYFYTLYHLRGPSILVCYFLAGSISIQIIRFTDAFSHTYEVVPLDAPRKYLSKSYDMANTYSIEFVTDRNMAAVVKLFAQLIHVGFFLNFNFHNQHHYATQRKWYELDSSIDESSHSALNNQVDVANEQEHIMNNQPDEIETSALKSIPGSLCGIPKSHFTIPLPVALRAFHRHRLNRVHGEPGKPYFDPVSKTVSLDKFYGVADASVLVLEL